MRPDPRAGLTLKFQDTCSGGEHRARQTAPRWRPGGHGWPSLSVAIHRRNSRDDLSAPPCGVEGSNLLNDRLLLAPHAGERSERYSERADARRLSGVPELRGWDSNPQPFG
jgi:hypothetical protein